ncbi:MAG: substrate-binding domain-containing protein [Betaproteobacteria bacterium]|nr:substrate-binding domain-containing protein [Betaproteobacteria bacterium]
MRNRTPLTLLIALLSMVGCEKESGLPAQAGSEGKKYFVAFSQCNNAEPYRAAQNQRMTELWSKHKDVKFVIADSQQDDRRQIEQVRTFIRQKPDLLIVAPNQRAPLTGVMGEAMAAGIKVICLERDIVEPNYTSFIRADNYAIGEAAGKFIVDHLKQKYGAPKGNIVQIKGLLGVEGETNRNNGAANIFKQHPDIKIVHEGVADWIQSKGKDRMIEALNANPKIDVVYGHNDPMAIGAYLAAKEKGRETEMIFIGIDGLGGPAGGIKQVMDGVLAATFVYPLCVDKAVDVGNQMLRGPAFKPEKTYTMDSQMVTPENATELYQKS